MTIETVRARLKSAVTEAGSLRLASIRLGVSHSFIADVLNGNREPGGKLLKAMGLEKQTTTRTIYRKVGK